MRFEEERRKAALEDLCRCPGLLAGFYEDLDLLDPEWLDRRYRGGAGFLGISNVYPTPEGRAALELMR